MSATRRQRGAPFSAARARADELKAAALAELRLQQLPCGPNFILCLSPSQVSAAPDTNLGTPVTESAQTLSALGKSVFDRLLLSESTGPRSFASSPSRGAVAVWAALSLPLESLPCGDAAPTHTEEAQPRHTNAVIVSQALSVTAQRRNTASTPLTPQRSAIKEQRLLQTPQMPLPPRPAYASTRQNSPSTPAPTPAPTPVPTRPPTAPLTAPLSAVSAAAAFRLALARASAEMSAFADEIAAAKSCR